MDNPEVQIPSADNADLEMEGTREPVEQNKDDATAETVEQQKGNEKDAESTQDTTVVASEGDSVAVPEKTQGLKFIEYGYPFLSSMELFKSCVYCLNTGS